MFWSIDCFGRSTAAVTAAPLCHRHRVKQPSPLGNLPWCRSLPWWYLIVGWGGRARSGAAVHRAIVADQLRATAHASPA
jgi:hypothetical protein